MNKRTLFIVTSLIVCLSVFQSCTKKNDFKKTEINIGTFSRAIDYSPFYIAKYHKWFEELPELKGAKINYSEFSDRALISDAFKENKLDMLFAAEPPMIVTRDEGREIRIVEVSCTLQQEIVVQATGTVRSVADLRGKHIAVLAATSSHYGLLKILAANNIAPSEVTIELMMPDIARAAFEKKQIEGWAVWPPFVEEQQVSGRGRVLTGGDAKIQSVVAIPTSLLNNDKIIASALVSVIQKAKNWIQANPQEAESIVANELSLNPEVVKTAWGKHNWKATLSDDVIDDIQKKADFLQKMIPLKSHLDVKNQLIDSRFKSQ
jgi:sulfonate transport system substrate-binding protein